MLYLLRKYSRKGKSIDKIRNQIYKSIENQIINRELKPGDKLPPENELCKIWNTSRISLRQALERPSAAKKNSPSLQTDYWEFIGIKIFTAQELEYLGDD
ncbi:MAG: winged helix-turn-helix domain-containing protein [Negativicutes bacterium]|nr:winged helix-turn-helix domain-containing protein [Negativicutes bacterium]